MKEYVAFLWNNLNSGLLAGELKQGYICTQSESSTVLYTTYVKVGISPWLSVGLFCGGLFSIYIYLCVLL